MLSGSQKLLRMPLSAHADQHALLGATPGAVFTKYGVTAFDITRAEAFAGFAVTANNCTHSISNERGRWSAYSRRLVLTASPAEFKPRAVSAGAPLSIFADPTENAFSVAVYLEENPTEFANPNNPYITLYLSNLWSGGANQSRWTFSSQYLRQGWNILTVRQADVVSGVEGAGDMPAGQTRNSDLGTGFNWSQSLEFMNFTFTNFPSGAVVHIDQVRRPAKAKPVLVIGFDAIGAFSSDEVLKTKVAPLFRSAGIRGYATMTHVYDILYAGGAGWTRFGVLQKDWLWDAIPHTWSHGATAVGGNMTLASLVSAADLVTVTYASAHGIALGRKYKAKISGASITAANGVFELTATTTTQATYTAAGAGSGTATGTIKLNTFLSEVFSSDTTENRRLMEQELVRNTMAMRTSGFARGIGYLAYPNNSVPHIDVIGAVASKAGVVLGRGARGGYAFLDEIGIDNPLNFGSYILDNGVTLATKTSYIQGKVAGAIARGVHLHIFGHFILDDEDPANSAYAPVSPDDPPGVNGNPAPPGGASQSGGGWWYLSQLRTLVESTIKPAVAAGNLLVMSPSEYVRYLGFKNEI